GGRSATTDSFGNYNVQNVPTGLHEIIPSSTNGFEFDPRSQFVDVTTNLLGIDFRAVFSIAGQVLEAGVGIEDATVTITNGPFTRIVFTDASGNYASGPLDAGTYTLVAQSPGRAFFPVQ